MQTGSYGRNYRIQLYQILTNNQVQGSPVDPVTTLEIKRLVDDLQSRSHSSTEAAELATVSWLVDRMVPGPGGAPCLIDQARAVVYSLGDVRTSLTARAVNMADVIPVVTRRCDQGNYVSIALAASALESERAAAAASLAELKMACGRGLSNKSDSFKDEPLTGRDYMDIERRALSFVLYAAVLARVSVQHSEASRHRFAWSEEAGQGRENDLRAMPNVQFFEIFTEVERVPASAMGAGVLLVTPEQHAGLHLAWATHAVGRTLVRADNSTAGVSPGFACAYRAQEANYQLSADAFVGPPAGSYASDGRFASISRHLEPPSDTAAKFFIAMAQEFRRRGVLRSEVRAAMLASATFPKRVATLAFAGIAEYQRTLGIPLANMHGLSAGYSRFQHAGFNPDGVEFRWEPANPLQHPRLSATGLVDISRLQQDIESVRTGCPVNHGFNPVEEDAAGENGQARFLIDEPTPEERVRSQGPLVAALEYYAQILDQLYQSPLYSGERV